MPVGVRAGLGTAAAGLVVCAGLAMASFWTVDERQSTFAILPISQPYAARSDYRLNGHRPTKQDLLAAEADSRKELEIAPRRSDGYLRLAMIEVLRDGGGLTVAGLNDLRRSYEVAPLDPDYWAARVKFAMEHWGELDAPLRLKVAAELASNSRYRSEEQAKAVVLSVENPMGRLGGLLSILDTRPSFSTGNSQN